MITFGFDGISVVWDLKTQTKLHSFDAIDCQYHIACNSHDNRYAMGGGYDNSLQIFDLVTYKNVYAESATGCMIYDMCVTLDNKYLVIGGASPNVFVFNLKEFVLEHTLPGHTELVGWMNATHDGKYVLSTSYTETIVWCTKTWKNLVVIEDRFILSSSKSRLLRGILHESLYKEWSTNILI